MLRQLRALLLAVVGRGLETTARRRELRQVQVVGYRTSLEKRWILAGMAGMAGHWVLGLGTGCNDAGRHGHGGPAGMARVMPGKAGHTGQGRQPVLALRVT